MKAAKWRALLSLAILCGACAAKTGRPVDQPFSCESDAVAQVQELVKPYIKRAHDTYPQARARWQNGLPPGYTFFLTTYFQHSTQHFEQIFVRVIRIDGERVYGVIASTPLGPGYKQGQPYEFHERDAIDWTIQRPDGSEEGNFVGNFLDRYHGQCPN